MFSIKKFTLYTALAFTAVTPCLARNKHKTIAPKAIICDLGSTLVRPSKGSIAASLGIWDAFCFFAYHGRRCPSLMKDTIFEILADGTIDTKHVSRDPSGQVLPSLMCNWFEGKLTSNEVRKKAHEKLNKYEHFVDERHKQLTERTIDWMFNPSIFGHSMKPVKGACHVLQACTSIKDKNGKQLHSLYILSNWDAESFDVMYHDPANRCIFKYFKPENMFISAREHDIKPRPSFFKHLLKKAHLKAKDCVFLDDQDENIKAAQALGMTAIKVNYKNYTDVYRKLKALHVI